MEEIEITPQDIEAAKRALDNWAMEPWTRIRMAVDLYEDSLSLPTITNYKEWFPCCTEASAHATWNHVLSQFVHFCSKEHNAWRHGLSPERFKKAEQCLKVIQVLSG